MYNLLCDYKVVILLFKYETEFLLLLFGGFSSNDLYILESDEHHTVNYTVCY